MTRDEWKQMYSKPPSVWPSVAVTLALISSLVACKLVFPGGGTQNQTVIINVSGSGSDPSGNADTCKVAGGFQPTVATVPPADTLEVAAEGRRPCRTCRPLASGVRPQANEPQLR